MVNDHYRGEEPNVEAMRFFNMLEAGKNLCTKDVEMVIHFYHLQLD